MQEIKMLMHKSESDLTECWPYMALGLVLLLFIAMILFSGDWSGIDQHIIGPFY